MKPSHAVLLAAIVANVLGWVLPAIDDYRGWSAFTVSLSPLWAFEDFRDEPVWLLILMVGSALTNFLFVALAALLVRGGAAKLVLWCAAAATLLDLHWVLTLESDRRYLAPGYFVWVCSFALLALAAFLDRRAAPAPR
ncbi:MAG TPA: hypothetical protein VKA43_17650 [Gammaproteobacteria bacterium]|nr:hypothetical protein [Gammaproteobacteria bacterium]